MNHKVKLSDWGARNARKRQSKQPASVGDIATRPRVTAKSKREERRHKCITV